MKEQIRRYDIGDTFLDTNAAAFKIIDINLTLESYLIDLINDSIVVDWLFSELDEYVATGLLVQSNTLTTTIQDYSVHAGDNMGLTDSNCVNMHTNTKLFTSEQVEELIREFRNALLAELSKGNGISDFTEPWLAKRLREFRNDILC